MVKSMTRRASSLSMISTLGSFMRWLNSKSCAYFRYLVGLFHRAVELAVGRRTVLALHVAVERANAGLDHVDQELDVEWLADRAGDDLRIEIARLHAGGEHDDQRTLKRRPLFDPLQKFVAAHARHHHVD